MQLTDYHAKYFAHELTKRYPSDSAEKLAGALLDAHSTSQSRIGMGSSGWGKIFIFDFAIIPSSIKKLAHYTTNAELKIKIAMEQSAYLPADLR
jgi:hypothetical protein